jgi:hypothetical protein
MGAPPLLLDQNTKSLPVRNMKFQGRSKESGDEQHNKKVEEEGRR